MRNSCTTYSGKSSTIYLNPAAALLILSCFPISSLKLEFSSALTAYAQIFKSLEIKSTTSQAKCRNNAQGHETNILLCSAYKRFIVGRPNAKMEKKVYASPGKICNKSVLNA